MLSQTVLRALRFAFPLTVPIAAGFYLLALRTGYLPFHRGYL